MSERRGPGRPRVPAHRVKHGTAGGHVWHYRQGEKPCEECRDWKRTQDRRRYKEAKEKRRIVRWILTRENRRQYTQKELDTILRAIRLTATAAELKELDLD